MLQGVDRAKRGETGQHETTGDDRMAERNTTAAWNKIQ